MAVRGDYRLSGIVALIHLLPLIGVLGDTRLAALYGIEITDPNLLILMRHRAVLFGLLGLFFVIAAFVPKMQWLAITYGVISTLSFILIAYQVPAYNRELAKVIMIDWVALGTLLAAALAKLFVR